MGDKAANPEDAIERGACMVFRAHRDNGLMMEDAKNGGRQMVRDKCIKMYLNIFVMAIHLDTGQDV